VSPSPNNAAQRGDDDDDDEDYLQSEQVRVWWQSVVCGSVYILPQFVAMMENMDANDYAAAFDANALPRLAGVIAGGNEEQAAVAWRVVRCGSNVGDFGGDNEVADVILAAAALALTSDRFVKCLSIWNLHMLSSLQPHLSSKNWSPQHSTRWSASTNQVRALCAIVFIWD
jgi:hypothetical protein